MTWAAQPRAEVQGVPAIVAGSGPLVVLLHGVGLRAEAWTPVIKALSRDFTVIAPDMPGHGTHSVSAYPASLSAYTDALAPVLSARSLVVGHSMGAMIALDLAARHATRVGGVAALNAVFERGAKAQAAVQARAAALDGTSVANPEMTLERWFGASDSPERRACFDWLTSVDPAGYKAAYTVFAHENGPDRQTLAALPGPALFMTGGAEPNSTPQMSRTMAALAPCGRARAIAGAAHMMPMTHPAETFAALRDLAEEVFS